MKLTSQQLRKIIKEEVESLVESAAVASQLDAVFSGMDSSAAKAAFDAWFDKKSAEERGKKVGQSKPSGKAIYMTPEESAALRKSAGL